MGCVFNLVRHLSFGGVCLGGLILMQGGCASLVFDELSDMRGGTSASHSGGIVSAAKFGGSADQIVYGAAIDTHGRVVMAGATLDKSAQDLGCGLVGEGGLDMFVTWVDPNDLTVQCPTSRLFGGLGNDVPFAIAVNPISGGLGVVGSSTGDFDCGSGSLTPNHGGRDVAAATFVGDTCSWQSSFGDAEEQEGRAIAFDSAGAAYIGGRFKGTLDVGSPLANTQATGFDAFVAKLSIGVGTPPWNAQAGGEGDQEVHSIVVTEDDTLLVGGRFSESVSFDCPALSIQNPAHDGLFVSAFDASGKCTQLVKIAEGPPEDTPPLSLAVAPDGDIFVAGAFHSRTLLPEHANCKQVNDTQTEAVFVAKFNVNWECQWSRRYGDGNEMVAGRKRAYAIAIDAASDVYVTGEFDGSIAFDEKHAYQSLGHADAFVLKLNSAGEYVWSNTIAAAGNESGHAVVLDASGEFVFVAGSFSDGSLNLAGRTLTPTGSDVFLAKLRR